MVVVDRRGNAPLADQNVAAEQGDAVHKAKISLDLTYLPDGSPSAQTSQGVLEGLALVGRGRAQDARAVSLGRHELRGVKDAPEIFTHAELLKRA